MKNDSQKKAAIKLSVNATLCEVEEAGKDYLDGKKNHVDWIQVANDLYALTGAHYVMVCEYDEKENTLITKAVDGIPMKVEAVVLRLGFNLIGKKWSLYDGVKEELLKPEVKVIESVLEASSYNLSEFMSFTIEKLLGVGAIYSKGFVYEGKLLGNYVLFMGKKQKLTSLDNVNKLEEFIVKALAAENQ